MSIPAPSSNATPLGTVLSRLDGVIPRGTRKYSARCPAHADSSPSLDLLERDDGAVLMICRVGCSAQDVLEALGLTFRDLYPDDQRAAYRAATASAGRSLSRQLTRGTDPLLLERLVLRIAAEDLRQGRELSLEDRGRVELARIRLGAVPVGGGS